MTCILAIDPSSTCTGYAALIGPTTIWKSGLIKPPDTLPARDRVLQMTKVIGGLLFDTDADDVVIEVPSGKVNYRRHKGGGAGLAVYGFAVGALWHTCRAFRGDLVHCVTETEWCRGVPKATRQAAVASEFRDYDPSTDPGGDVSDAIALAQWWIQERRVSYQTR